MHYKTTKRLLTILLVSILSVVSFGGCDSIYDDLNDCHVYIRFKDEYNMDKQDKFAEECDKVEIFIFDKSDVLSKVITEEGNALKTSNYQVEIPIHSGDYTVMAWVGRKDSYDLTGLTVGTSTKKDLLLKLKSSDNKYSGDLDPLWWGTPVNFNYSGGSHHIETINLIKNTNKINFTLYHNPTVDPLSLANIEVKITTANGSYDYDNTSSDTQTINYTPFNSTAESLSETSEKVSFSLSTLRLVKGQNVRFSVINKATGSSLLPAADMDLIEYLLKTKPNGMTDQEYLDRQDTWNINLFIANYISTSIVINGWTVWTQEGKL